MKGVLLNAVLFAALAPAAVCAGSIPRPEGIQQDVNFWVRVYTEVTTNEGFLHDERNLAVIYDTLKFGAGMSSRDRQRVVDERRDRHIAALRRIIAALPSESGREACRRKTNACSRCGVRVPARCCCAMPRNAFASSSDSRIASRKA